MHIFSSSTYSFSLSVRTWLLDCWVIFISCNSSKEAKQTWIDKIAFSCKANFSSFFLSQCPLASMNRLLNSPSIEHSSSLSSTLFLRVSIRSSCCNKVPFIRCSYNLCHEGSLGYQTNTSGNLGTPLGINFWCKLTDWLISSIKCRLPCSWLYPEPETTR